MSSESFASGHGHKNLQSGHEGKAILLDFSLIFGNPTNRKSNLFWRRSPSSFCESFGRKKLSLQLLTANGLQVASRSFGLEGLHRKSVGSSLSCGSLWLQLLESEQASNQQSTSTNDYPSCKCSVICMKHIVHMDNIWWSLIKRFQLHGSSFMQPSSPWMAMDGMIWKKPLQGDSFVALAKLREGLAVWQITTYPHGTYEN